ncbi:MAG: clostripain-related cysteine peptidase [Treponema sp.]
MFERKPVVYTVSVQNTEGGAVTVNPLKAEYAKGEFVTVTAKADREHRFNRWRGSLTGTENPFVIKIQEPLTIIADFTAIPQYTLNTSASEGGKVLNSEGEKTKYLEHERCTLTAQADAGYEFVRWEGDVSGTNNKLYLTFDKNYQVHARFKKATEYHLRATAGEGGKIINSAQKIIFSPGEQCILTAQADAGYEFVQWEGDAGSTSDKLYLTFDKNYQVYARFKKATEYHLRATAGEGGKIINSAQKVIFSPGEQCILTAQADVGYEFVQWEGDAGGTSDKLYLTFDKNYQVYARFRANEAIYTVNITQSGNGSIIRSNTKEYYAHNELLTLKAQAADGWKFKQWSSGVSEEKKYEEEITVRIDGHKSISAEFVKRQWTFVVYMAADNDLEAAAMLDMNELEAAEWNGKAVNMLVLLDRHPGYDASDGNWSGTRLYEVRQDKNGVNNTVVSKRLSCGILGLREDQESELDMSRKEVMSRLLEYAKETYRAEQYGLLIWGHGTGWRGSGSGGVKGIGIDASSGNGEMKVSELAEAVSGKGLTVIGFDTCFGGIAEVFYELEGLCEYGIGSSGATPSSGWDYRDVFNRFFSIGLSERDFCEAVTESYKGQYGGTPGADITVCDIGKIGAIVTAWEDLSSVVSSSIDSREEAELVRRIVLKESITYRFSRYPSDVYADMKDSARLLREKAGELTGDSTVQQRIRQEAAKVEESIERAVTGWIAGKGEGGHLGIYVAPMGSAETVAGVHDAGYVRGSGTLFQSKLVKESKYWVVQQSKDKSVLDKLFYQYR